MNRSLIVGLVATLVGVVLAPAQASASNCSTTCRAEVIVAPSGFYYNYLRLDRFIRRDCQRQQILAHQGEEFYDYRDLRGFNALRTAVNIRLARRGFDSVPSYDRWAYDGRKFRLHSGKLIGSGCPHG